MRLKVKKLLKGGKHLVFFENVDFSPQERRTIRKLGIPLVDLSAEGLGMRRLDKMDFSIECPSPEEAEKIISHIKQRIKSKLNELSAQAEHFTFGRMVKTYTTRIAVIFGILSAIAILVLLAYHGVISSQKIAQLGKRIFATVTHKKISSPPPKGEVEFPKTSESPQLVGVPTYQEKLQQSENKIKPTEAFLQKPESGSLICGKQDFLLTVEPETLMRYYDWGSDLGDQTVAEQFKLILMGTGGFEGPVDLEVSGSCYLVKRYLYPTQIQTLPGSATLIISLLPQCPHQVCSDLTVIARGITSKGDLLTHQKNLMLVIREKPLYAGKVWHVSPYGDDLLGHGDSSSPFRTIQKGIDCAEVGDTVLVERGIYKENIHIIDKDRILVASRFLFDREESTVKSTIIEPQKTGWVVTVGRSHEVTLCGFTIRKGGSDNGSPGGGIYCYDSSPNILDNIITQNMNQAGYGAGIYCYHSKPKVLRNKITQNSNYNGHGAGIYGYNSELDIQNNVISGNHSSGGGSAIHLLQASSVKIIRNLIYGDSGSSAILLHSLSASSDLHLVNNTVSNNQGDGIRYFGGPWFLKNNIISANAGYGLFTLEGTANLAYNDIWGNVSGNVCKRDTIDYYGLSENPIKNNGNISKDPCFGNPVHGNFRLCFNSPCIDLGSPDDPIPPEGGLRIDIGAIEYASPEIVCGDMNRDGLIDFGDVTYLANFLSRRVPPPDPVQIGDVNCDDQIDKSDIAYLYEFLYYYGPEPGANCKDRKLVSSKKQ